MNRRGSLIDIITMIVMMGVISVVLLVVSYAWSSINTGLQTDSNLGATALTQSQSLYDRFKGVFDGIFFSLLMFFWLGTIATAFMIDTHPILFFVSVIALVIFMAITPVIANVYMSVAADTNLATVESNYTMMPWIMQNYVKIMVVVGFSILVALYAKIRAPGE